MGTDSNFVANDGSSVTTGMMSWGTKDFNSTFVTGVWGLGAQWGVLGQIDDLSPSPSFYPPGRVTSFPPLSLGPRLRSPAWEASPTPASASSGKPALSQRAFPQD